MFEDKINELTEVQKAQLATAIDAEGNVGIYHTRSRNKRYKSGYNEMFTPTLRISNQNREWLEYFKNMVGCGWIDKKPHGGKAYLDKRGKTLTLNWKCRKAHNILKQVFPFLIIKRKQATMIFEWYELKSKLGAKQLSFEQAEKFLNEHIDCFSRKGRLAKKLEAERIKYETIYKPDKHQQIGNVPSKEKS